MKEIYFAVNLMPHKTCSRNWQLMWSYVSSMSSKTIMIHYPYWLYREHKLVPCTVKAYMFELFSLLWACTWRIKTILSSSLSDVGSHKVLIWMENVHTHCVSITMISEAKIHLNLWVYAFKDYGLHK